MKRFIILIAALALLLLSCIPFVIDRSTPVVPGWHVTIFPPQFIFAVIILIVLLIVLAYLLLVPFAYLSFIAGQVILGIYLYRVFKRKKNLAL